MVAIRKHQPTVAAGDIPVNIRSFEWHLRAENRFAQTIRTYAESAGQFAAIRRGHVESFTSHLLVQWKPATAGSRYRGLQAFFRWLADEGEMKTSPVEQMKPPRLPEEPPDVLQEAQLRAMLKMCEGAAFDGRRDAALLRIFIDTCPRLAEVAGLRYSKDDDTANDVDPDQGLIRVLGKGRRGPVIAIGKRTVKALDRYLRVRAAHHSAETP